ncbi:NAD(P)-dependent oxidoreductase [Candidatus Bipolaricaulota bacterium]|nr:NAD(P)-dependent oxidoreductase [Candidatus Bipolaricaulota bacterium]
MRILITGATGYVGGNLVLKLLKNSSVEEIIALGRKGEKASILESEVKNPSKLDFVLGDLTKSGSLVGLGTKKIDQIIHLAAARGPSFCSENPKAAVDVNIGATYKLLDVARQENVSSFIYMSTRSIYGNQETRIVSEQATPSPNDIYGLTKYGGEVLTSNLKNESIGYIILRPSRVYGLGIFMRRDNLLGRFTEQSINGDSLTIYGDGEQLVDLIHIKDLCRFIAKIVFGTHNECWGHVYNIGGGKFPSINDLASTFKKVCKRLGLPGPGRKHVENANTRNCSPLLDITKAKNALNCEPSVPLHQGVRELLKFARKDN